MAGHADLANGDLHPIGYISASDPAGLPGGVQPYATWIDTALGDGQWILRVRNAANTAWELLGAGSFLTFEPAGASFRFRNGQMQIWNVTTSDWQSFSFAGEEGSEYIIFGPHES